MARKKNNNFFEDFWNGDVSLVKSYWLVGVVLSFAVGFFGALLILGVGLHFNAVYAIIIPWLIYTTVGIWRSSDKYKGPKHWAVLAKVAVVIGIIINLRDLLTGTV